MVHRITLPEKLSPKSIFKLNSDFAQALKDKKTKSIVISGRKGVFCEGLDFTSLQHGSKRDVELAVSGFADCLRTISLSPKPVIGMINGSARGGGVGLAAVCDVAIASQDSLFAIPELLFGLLPAVIMPFLRERLSIRQCRLWAITGQSKNASQALQMGLVDDVVPTDKLEAAVTRWKRYLGRADPTAVHDFKQLIERSIPDREAAIELGIARTCERLQDRGILMALENFAKIGTPPWENNK